jgi:hypothetical protein
MKCSDLVLTAATVPAKQGRGRINRNVYQDGKPTVFGPQQ